jgi:hypothetical protein
MFLNTALSFAMQAAIMTFGVESTIGNADSVVLNASRVLSLHALRQQVGVTPLELDRQLS